LNSEWVAEFIVGMDSPVVSTLDAMHLMIAQRRGFEAIASAGKLFGKAAGALGFNIEVLV